MCTQDEVNEWYKSLVNLNQSMGKLGNHVMKTSGIQAVPSFFFPNRNESDWYFESVFGIFFVPCFLMYLSCFELAI